jgi:hypothetical protein
VDVERATRQLAVIGEVAELAEERGIEIWLRGGWAMDFFIGEFTRDHEDIDWFAWGSDRSRLAGELLGRSFESLSGPPPDQQLDVAKGDLVLNIALMARDEQGAVVVNGGPWAGEAWPDGMLEAPPGRLGPLRCRIISPQAQIEIKEMMPLWVPEAPHRAKDADDVDRLRAAMRKRNL